MKTKVKVIGSGFSGLTMAYLLLKEGFKVEIHEKQDRPGGLIQTEKSNRSIIESAANGFLASDNIVKLLQDLKLNILTTHKKSKKRFIYYKNKPSRWPFTIIGSLMLIRGVSRVLFKKKQYRPKSQESVENWSLRTFGSDFTYNALGPGLNGIYAGNISKMSATLLFSKFFIKSLRIKKSKQYKGTISVESEVGKGTSFVICFPR